MMKARSCILCITVLFGGYTWSRQSRLTQHDPYPLYTTKWPYNYLTTNERRIAKDMTPIFDNERFRFNLTALRGHADSSTDAFKQHKQPLFNIPGPWNMLAPFYNQSPVLPTNNPGSSPNLLQLTPKQAYLAQILNISTDVGNLDNDPDNDAQREARAFQKVLDPLNSDSNEEFGYMDVPGEYRKHGLRAEIEALIGCGFGMRVSTGVSDIHVIPCIARACANPSSIGTDTPCDFRDSTKCDLLNRTCKADGRTCTVFNPPSSATSCGSNDEDCIFESFTKADKDLVMNKIIEKFDKIAAAFGYDATNYNETDIEDIDFQLYWRHPVHINEDRATWPYVICTPFFVGHATAPIADAVPGNHLFALAHGNNGFAAYGLSGGFTLDFVDMVQLSFDAGMTRFSEEHRSCIPVPTHRLQQGLLPRFADADVKPGTNWSFGAGLYGYYMYDRLSFYIEYRLVSHTEDEVTFKDIRPLSQEQLSIAGNYGGTLVNGNNESIPNQNDPSDIVTLNDIKKDLFIERTKWESHVVNMALNYDISPNVSLGFLWQAPATRRNAFKQSSLLWTIAVTI